MGDTGLNQVLIMSQIHSSLLLPSFSVKRKAWCNNKFLQQGCCVMLWIKHAKFHRDHMCWIKRVIHSTKKIQNLSLFPHSCHSKPVWLTFLCGLQKRCYDSHIFSFLWSCLIASCEELTKFKSLFTENVYLKQMHTKNYKWHTRATNSGIFRETNFNFSYIVVLEECL